jgi:CO/xanthine dehydrogenase Mo-binding subunit
VGPDIGKSVKRVDVPDKIAGKAKYIGDYAFERMLFARTLRSTKPRARIRAVKYPVLPEGCYIVDKNDVPGVNRIKIVETDMPCFADGVVNYIGEPIALVVGPEKKTIMEILSQISVEYEELEPILSIEEGLNTQIPIFKQNNCFADYAYSKGDVEKAARDSRYVFEGDYETGYQEQMYLEPQGVIGDYNDGKVTVYASIQCPYYVKNALQMCLGLPPDRIRVVQSTTGGAFGGKEEYPSLIAGQIACAAIKCGKPVQLIFDRAEDMEATTKRHPSKIHLKSYLDENYRIIGEEACIYLDAGAYAGLSAVVLQRAIFAAIGVYNVENVSVRGKAVATSKAVSGAFRGFGGPQAFFAAEMHMEHMARELGIDLLELRRLNLLKQGDRTSTGGTFRDRIMLPEMTDRILDMSQYCRKKESFALERKRGGLKGIGISLFFHGGGFTGSGERDMIKAAVKLVKYPDGMVEILIANVEMGQGAQTSMRKIAAHALGIALEKVIYQNPDTDRVPDSGPTVASRTTVIVGKLIMDASEKLKSRWDEAGTVEAEAHYKHPEGFLWDGDKFMGDAYTSYSWGANVVEVEVDPITYEVKVESAYAVFDIGKAIDERIVKGQIDGGMLQGLGYGGIEVMENRGGVFLQRSVTDYAIPTSKDAPRIESALVCEPYEGGPYGAKSLGELTLVGAPAAYALAVEDALGIRINKIPVRPEYLMEVCENGR